MISDRIQSLFQRRRELHSLLRESNPLTGILIENLASNNRNDMTVHQLESMETTLQITSFQLGQIEEYLIQLEHISKHFNDYENSPHYEDIQCFLQEIDKFLGCSSHNPLKRPIQTEIMVSLKRPRNE